MKASRHEPESTPFPVGSRVLAKIHPIEREHGIFIPGHRFEPLRNLTMAPWLLKLEAADQSVFKSRKISLTMRDAELFHMLFGKPEFLYLLIGQDKFNIKVLEQVKQGTGLDTTLARIQVYDFSKFYEINQLSAGDYLSLESMEPAGKAFKVSAVPASNITKARSQTHIAALDKAVEATLISLDGPTEPSIMIREIYRHCDPVIFEKPAIAFSEYFNSCKKLDISDFGASAYMWKAGEQTASKMWTHEEGLSDDATELEEIIDECGLSISEAEIEAFVCDALYRGKKARSGFDRIIDGIEDFGIPEDKMAELKQLGYDLADEVAESYNRSDEIAKYAKLRTELVDLYARFLVWMRHMGSVMQHHEDIQTEEFQTLSEAMSGICEALEFVNDTVDDDELDDEESQALAEIKRSLPTLRTSVLGLMGEVENQLRNPKSRPLAGKYFMINLKIDDIEPPIRRQLLVPGNRTLADLHTIIQHAYAWSDSHLHMFRLRNENYGVPSPDDFEMLLDESMYRLDDLRLRGRTHIKYIYDFGDNWEHDVLIQTSIPFRPGDPDIVVCMSGVRARPPEDCGGVPGYEAIMAALAKPRNKRNAEEKRILTWLGDWDPEHFDLEYVNQALAGD